MSDLSEQSAALVVKMTGSDNAGLETNYINADSNGNLGTVLKDSTGTVVGTSNPLNVTQLRNLTAAAPTSITAGIVSSTLIATNSNRKGLIITNLSTARISLNLVGGAAVINSGVTLIPGGVFNMDSFCFTTSQINVIASLASSAVSIQEFS